QEGRQAMNEVLIAYDHPWQEQHWESLCSAYRSSPYFEYFEDDIRPLYRECTDRLIDFNTRLLDVVCGLAGIRFKPEFTEDYRESWPDLQDWRERLEPDFSEAGPAIGMEPYTQVFDRKFGFLPNLSVFDLLFNAGPHLAGHLPGRELLAG